MIKQYYYRANRNEYFSTIFSSLRCNLRITRNVFLIILINNLIIKGLIGIGKEYLVNNSNILIIKVLVQKSILKSLLIHIAHLVAVVAILQRSIKQL